jgi:hypothetical protein
VPFPRPEVDIRVVPEDFDGLVEWLERWSYNLVLLEEYALADVRTALEAVDHGVKAHRTEFDARLRSLSRTDDETARGAKIVRSDHDWFETSVDQLWWFFRVVENEDHGGHRQALGQYGRVLAEALRRHRTDERQLLDMEPSGKSRVKP